MGEDVEDPTNFLRTLVLSVIRMCRVSEEIMIMSEEASETLEPLSLLVTEGNMIEFAPRRVPIYLHPSLCRDLKLIFQRDI